MIPLALVTGFLGSGKTTFLRHLSHAHAGRRLAFVVNDFAAIDVDAQTLADLDGEIVSLPGGSIFCRCLATTFTKALKHLAALDPPVEGVIVEASGMADPRSVAGLLRETQLDRLFTLSTVIALADPGTFYKLLATLPAVRSQIETADVVLLNKTDLHSEEEIVRTEQALRSVRDDVAIVRCVRAEVGITLFQGASQALRVQADLTPCRDRSFQAATVPFDPKREREPAWVLAILDRHADILWRAKGHVPGAQGFTEIQWTLGSPAVATPCPPSRRITPALVLVARGDADPDALDRLVAELS